MDEKKKQLLQEIGVDIPGAMERFMQNEEMYWHFLCKLQDNTQFEELKQAIEQEDWEQSLITSHNLKSLCGNLALTRIHQLLTAQVNQLRAGDHAGAAATNGDILKEYERILGLVKNFAG